jgi:xanthine dehydrogenase accessory factor
MIAAAAIALFPPDSNRMTLTLPLVVIKGAGDLASGVALRLHRAGFPVVLTETPLPLAVRRSVAFAQAVYNGECTVEEVRGRLCSVRDVAEVQAKGAVPVLVDPHAQCRNVLQPPVLVDAIMAKRNTGTRLVDAPHVIALGPGFTVGADCHAIIETNRGHDLGRVLWEGSAEPDTGTPGELPGVGGKASRVLRAPAAGHVAALAEIGDHLAEGQRLAVLRGQEGGEVELLAPFAGVLRGIIHPRVHVTRGMKIGDVDPRARREHCFTVSDKALAIAGGVLEAILTKKARHGHTQ